LDGIEDGDSLNDSSSQSDLQHIGHTTHTEDNVTKVSLVWVGAAQPIWQGR